MKKRSSGKKKILICVLVLAAVLAVDGLLFAGRYVMVSGKPYHRTTEQMDLRGQSLPEPEALARLENLKTVDLRGLNLTLQQKNELQELLPDCTILWDICFNDVCYDPGLTEIKITSLDENGVKALEQFENLQVVDARQCRDYGALAQLVSEKPELWAIYQVELAGKSWGQNTAALELPNGDAQEMMSCLPALPYVETLHLTGRLPGIDDLEKLQENFPQIRFSWDYSIDGRLFSSSDKELELAEAWSQSPENLKEQLRYFPEAEKIRFLGDYPGQGERDALQEVLPDQTFCWDYPIGENRYPMDLKELDLSGIQGLSLSQIEQAMQDFPELQKITVCGCGFPNEELDALNRKYEDIRVVWDVMLGGISVRTDALYYAPNKTENKPTREEAENLRYCTDMVCVDLGHASGLQHCRWAANMPNLRFLIIADSNIADLTPLQNLKKLEYLEAFLTPITDVSPLVGCTALKDLNLCYTKADPAPVKQMTWLKRLWWSGCPEAEEMLSGLLPDTEKNFTSRSSTGDTWRTGELYFEMRDIMGMWYMFG